MSSRALRAAACANNMADDWVVIGANGKAKRTNRHHGHQQPTHNPLQSSAPGSDIQAAQTGIIHQHPSGGELPGWGGTLCPPTASENRHRKRKDDRAGMRMPRNQDEEVEWLLRQIDSYREEVARSQFYSKLKGAWASTARHTVSCTACQCSPTSCHPSQPTSQPAQPAQARPEQESAEAAQTHWSASIQQLVLLGLGSVQDSKNSRYQLALAELLRQELLPCLRLPPHTYDPVYSQVDRLVLQRLGWQVAEEDTQCRVRAPVPTLFYLPHLEGHLCDQLLAANLSQSHTEQGTEPQACTLGHCVLLANSFQSYQDRWEVWGQGAGGGGGGGGQSKQQRSNADTATHVVGRPQRPNLLLALLAAGAVLEVPTPQESSFPAPSAFNDASLHLFRQPLACQVAAASHIPA